MLRSTILFSLLLTLVSCGQAPEPLFTPGPRRIIVISLDTLGAKHLESYGYYRETSPNISAVARAGCRFSNATAPSNWTLPSHASLFTGLYPARHGVREKHQILDDVPAHLVESLRDAGFATAGFTGGAYLNAHFGLDRGFDHYQSEQEWEHSTNETLTKAKQWLGGHRDHDVFLFLHTYEIHAPYTAPPQYARLFTSNPRSQFQGLIVQLQEMKKKESLRPQDIQVVIDRYDAGIAYTDDMLGEFLAWLAEEQLDSNMLLIISSDHGEEFWEHGDHSHGGDLLGNEVTQVPLIIRLPDGSGAGAVVAEEVSFLDIMPTVLDAVGVSRPHGLDGFSLMPELAGWPVKDIDSEARQRRQYQPDRPGHGVGICEGDRFVAAQTRHWKALTTYPGVAFPGHDLWPALFDLQADAAELAPLPPDDAMFRRLADAVERLVGNGRARRDSLTDATEVDATTRRQLEALGY